MELESNPFILSDNIPVVSYLRTLSVNNLEAIQNLITAGYSEPSRLLLVPPSPEDLNKYGFNDFERNLILKALSKDDQGLPLPSLPKLKSSGPIKKDEEINWYWMSDDNKWVLYDTPTATVIESAYSEKLDRVKLDTGKFIHKNYVVDFSIMKQINNDTHFGRSIKREIGVKDKEKEKDTLKKPNCNPALDVICAAAWDGNTERFLELLPFTDHESIIKDRNSRGQSVLYCAACGGASRIVSILLKTIKDIPLSGPQAPKDSTPLHGASWKGHADVVTLLILAGASINDVNGASLTPYSEAQKSAKYVYEILESEGKVGLSKLLPKPCGKLAITLKTCSGLPVMPAGPDSQFEARIKLLPVGDEISVMSGSVSDKLAVWRVSQEAAQKIKWEKNLFQLITFDFNKILIRIEITQDVESTEKGGTKSTALIATHEKVIDLGDLNQEVVQENLEVNPNIKDKPSSSSVSYSLKFHFIDEPKLAVAMEKETKSEPNWNEKQFNQWYSRMYQLHHELRTAALRDSPDKKSSWRAGIKKIAALTNSESKRIVVNLGNETGALYPVITLDDFSRIWDVLSPKQKFKHVIGYLNYMKPIWDIKPLILEKKSPDAFMDIIISLDYQDMIETLRKRHNTTELKVLCIYISKLLINQQLK